MGRRNGEDKMTARRTCDQWCDATEEHASGDPWCGMVKLLCEARCCGLGAAKASFIESGCRRSALKIWLVDELS